MISVERFINDDGITVGLIVAAYVLESVCVQTIAKLRIVSWHRLQDFEVDEFSNEYPALHPMPSTTKKASLWEEHFEAVEEEDEKAICGSDASSASELWENELENTKAKSKKKVQPPRRDTCFRLNNKKKISFFVHLQVIT